MKSRNPTAPQPTDEEVRAIQQTAKHLAPADNDRADAAAARERFRATLTEKHERAHALRREALAQNEEAHKLFLELARQCWSSGYALDADEYERYARACAPKGSPREDVDFLDY